MTLDTNYIWARRYRLIFTAVLAFTLILLLLTGLGAFRVYFDFEWATGPGERLLVFRVNVGNAFDRFDLAAVSPAVWWQTTVLVALVLSLPQLRVLVAPIVTLLGVVALVVIDSIFEKPPGVRPAIALEFELLIAFLLFLVYAAMSALVLARDRYRLTRVLSQYVPPELASRYGRNPDSLGLEGEEREITVMFCDIVDFTACSEALGAAGIVNWLNEFFTLVGRAVVSHGGSIDKYLGDSVMSVWGAPAPNAEHARDALAAALEIRAGVDEVSRRLVASGRPALRVGIGIATGPAHVGTLGSEFRRDYTVVGDTVNVAKRLESMTRRYRVPIVVADTTVAALRDLAFARLDRVLVRGRARPIEIYEPLPRATSTDDVWSSTDASTGDGSSDFPDAAAAYSRHS